VTISEGSAKKMQSRTNQYRALALAIAMNDSIDGEIRKNSVSEI